MRFQAMVLALVLILLASNAFGQIALIPNMKQANVSRNDSIGMVFQIKNMGYERECIDLDTEYDDRYIETHISEDHICLNGYESTTVTLTIQTDDARKGGYIVSLEA